MEEKMRVNEQLYNYFKILKEENVKILGSALIRDTEHSGLIFPWQIGDSISPFKESDSLEQCKTWDIDIHPQHGKTKLLSYLIITEKDMKSYGAMKPTSIKDSFERQLYNAKNKDNYKHFKGFVVAIQLDQQLYFHIVDNPEKAVLHFKNNYDEYFVNRFLSRERVIGFMLV